MDSKPTSQIPDRRNRPAGSGKVPKSAYLTFDVLREYFHLPISVVGKELGVCATMLKKICRKNGIPRWPYRQIKSLNRMIASLEGQPEDDEHVQSILKTLRFKRENLLGNPHMNEPLLRHRKQFRMITKKNGGSLAKPREPSASEDDMAVGVLSTLSSSSPERAPPVRPVVSKPPPPADGLATHYAFAGAYAQPPGAYTASFASSRLGGPAHYAQPRYAAGQPAHALAHVQTMQQAMPQGMQQAMQRGMAAMPAMQPMQPAMAAMPQPYGAAAVRSSTHFVMGVQEAGRVQYAPAEQHYAVVPAHRARPAAPSWHAQGPARAASAPQVPQMAPAEAERGLKLPELQFDGSPPADEAAPAAKLKALEPGAMSLQRLLAY